MLPHLEYVHSEQFGGNVVTTISTVYKQRNSSSLLPSISTHSTRRQHTQSNAFLLHTSKPARISRMTQTPQTGAYAVVVRALYCVPTLKHEEVLFECVRTVFLHAKQWILNRPYFQVVSGITPALQHIYRCSAVDHGRCDSRCIDVPADVP